MPKRRTFIFCSKDNGHVIGEVVLREIQNKQVAALYLYENSIEKVEHVPDTLPTKRGIIIGDSLGIECSICHAERDWKISKDTAIILTVHLLNSLYEPAKVGRRIFENESL